MPGFLGTEQQFNERYGRPILLSRDAKSSSKEQEAGEQIILNNTIKHVLYICHNNIQQCSSIY